MFVLAGSRRDGGGRGARTGRGVMELLQWLRGDPLGQRRYREAGSRLDRLGRLPQGNGACTHVPGPDVGEIRYGVPAGILATQ